MFLYRVFVVFVSSLLISTAMGEEKKKQNRLAKEKSPYLLQHASNPIDWYPWGEEAFAKAKKEHKPVFLSIGYSTCHWCHVMEKECFEDAEIAAYLNSHFVAVKVDREERPDIDSVYMKAASYLGSGGGWPLTVVMTPDKKPYFAGTYIPKYRKQNVEGLMMVLPQVYRQFRYKSNFMTDKIKRVEQRFSRANAPGPKLPDLEIDSDLVLERMLYSFDSVNGGFKRGSKFPRSHQLLYLLEAYKRNDAGNVLEAAKLTVDKIRLGGLYDHLGGGIHRYTVDPAWQVPHFEKMLYNQAQFAMAVTRLYAVSGEDKYKTLAADIYSYVARDLTSEEGAFYSAENADSEGEEGTFYLWKYDDLKAALSPQEFNLMSKLFALKEAGNWVDQAHNKQMPTNILFTSPEGAKLFDAMTADQIALFQSGKKKLLKHRKSRIRPSLDDKVLTNWNGLMIASLANASRELGEEKYRIAAEKAYKFIKKNLYKDGKLQHRWRDGEAAIPAMLTDYTFQAWGALELYKATQNISYLQDAVDLMKVVIKDFAHEQSGFYMTANDAETVLNRQFVTNDMALPSGNNVAYLLFSELSRFTADSILEQEAGKQQKLLARALQYIPQRRSLTGYALERRNAESIEVVLVSGDDGSDLNPFIESINKSGKNAYIHTKTSKNSAALEKLALFTKGHKAVNGKPTAYICINFACKAPVTTVKELEALLE